MSDIEDRRIQTETKTRNEFGYLVMGAGVLLASLGVLVGTTPILQFLLESTIYQAQRISGVLSGFGTLFIIYGMLYSIPEKSRPEIKIGALGTGLCLFAVIWFGFNFPHNWNVYDLTTVATVGFTYAFGILLLMGITFHALVNYRMKTTEKFTITHRFDSDNEDSSDDNQQSQQNIDGGIGVIGSVSSGPIDTFGPRKPMSKQDRDKHSLKRSSQRSNSNSSKTQKRNKR